MTPATLCSMDDCEANIQRHNNAFNSTATAAADICQSNSAKSYLADKHNKANERAEFVTTSKLVFLQAAEVTRFCQAEISQAEFVKTTKFVFCQAAEAARIRQAKEIHLADKQTTSKLESVAPSLLVFRQATASDAIAPRCTASKYGSLVSISLSVMSLHLDELPPSEPPPSEPPLSEPPPFNESLFYNSTSLML